MLKKISAENFLSFKDKVMFDFSKTEKPTTNTNVVTCALIFGENGSGKSNSINIIRFLIDNLFFETSNFTWYKNIFNSSDLINLEYNFILDKKDYNYTINIDAKEDLINELITIDNVIVLERNKSQIKIYDKVFNGISPTLLSLKYLNFNNVLHLFEILNNLYKHLKNYHFLNFDSELIKRNTYVDLISYIDLNGVEKLNTLLNKMKIPFKMLYEQIDQNLSLFQNETEIINDKLLNLKVLKDSNSKAINFKKESFGIKRLIILLHYLLKTDENSGVLLIDNFSFHNKLEELIINYFHKNMSLESQLFITTHSTNLLSSSICNADQIYLLKYKNESSKVSRVSEESPRENQNFERMYLNGMFD